MREDKWFQARARELYHEEGEIEIDSDARVSVGCDDGAYVAAWVWVPSEEEKLEEEKWTAPPSPRSPGPARNARRHATASLRRTRK
jgi:hypothetical protein